MQKPTASGRHAPQRPQGGKALVRLVQELTRVGLDEEAIAAIRVAAPDIAPHELVARAAGPETARTAREAAATREEYGDPGEYGAPVTQSVAAEYRAVAEHLAEPAAVAGPVWRSIGPWTVPNGQTYGTSRVNVSGRISSIAPDPADPAHLLVGAANGGVWESDDRGASWAPRTDDAATLTVGAIAFDPAAPGTVLAGTGEGNWWWWLGAGVLQSTDGGTKWTPLCTDPFVGQGFFDLTFDPTRENTVLAGTNRGLYTSTDGGASWTQRRSVRTWSVSVSGTGEALAACKDGLFRSTDGGAVWNAVALPGATTPFLRCAVATAPSDAAVAYAWAAFSSGPPKLWRRAGGTWTAVKPPAADTGQASYDWFLAVAPDRADRVYVGAIDAYRGEPSGTTWSWRNISTKSTGDSIHPDQHAIAFEPGSPDVLYVGNDGGLFRSPDRGISWKHLNNGLVISEFEYLSQDFGSSRWVLGGTQDNGTVRWTGSPEWTHVQDGDGGDCAVNRARPDTVFHTFYEMSPERSDSRGEPGSWFRVEPPVPDGEDSLFYPPMETSATNGSTVALGGGALYVSRDDAAHWTRLKFPTAGTASAMYVPHADQVLVGTTLGELYRTTWSGSAWSALSALATPRSGAQVSDIHVDATDTQRIWVTHSQPGGGRIWHSTDGGGSWTNRSAGLPPLPLNAVEVDPTDHDRVWVAADLGVYQSTDGGSTWQTFSDGLPNAFIGDIVLHPHARVLRAGTRNRGVWEIPVDGWPTEPVCGTQWTGTLAGGAKQTWSTVDWPATWHVLWTVMPVTPRPGAPQLRWTVQVERASNEYVTYRIAVVNLTSEPVSLEGRYAILSRY
ncbi:hypothetical protein [Streptomyces litmocidini]|uniref:Sortilin N-terminal domain-containing protein n=1 Tax=Streptomyces litmocidini TaxID=67318 RepID=A0ABW7UL81_9ACTN